MLARTSPPATPAERLSFGSARGAFMIAAVILQGQATWGVPDVGARHRFLDAAQAMADEDWASFTELAPVVEAGLDICAACTAHALVRMQPLATVMADRIARAGRRA